MTPQEIHAKLSGKFGAAIAEWQDPAAGDASVMVAAEKLTDVCQFLRDEPGFKFDYLRLISGVDRSDCLSSVYHLYSFIYNHSLVLRVDLDRNVPRVGTVTNLWPSADWHEREAYDMLGIIYEGHPDLHRILLPEDWDGFPLRKDYAAPKEYHGISNE